jgi:ribosomal protein L11 methyltransferase
MQWWNVYVQTPTHASDAVGAYLNSLGSAAVVIHEHASLSACREPCVDNTLYSRGSTVLQAAFAGYEDLLARLAALQQFMAVGVGCGTTLPWALYCCKLSDPRYLTRWQDFFHPFWVDDRLLIRPSWDTSPVPHARACLTIDPGLAFGTGTHPTTRMCLDVLADYAGQHQGGALLDAGCGSGILSLAALRLGLHTAVGVDVDPQAVAAAIANAAANELHDQAQFMVGWCDAAAGPFDMIVANIFLGPLVEMMQTLRRRLRSGGTLIVSGIIAPQEAAMTASLKAAGLSVCFRMLTGGWIALAARPAQEAAKYAQESYAPRVCGPGNP